MAIELHTFFNLMHYEYGEAFFGSYKGMRYRLAREPLENVKFVPVDKREKTRLTCFLTFAMPKIPRRVAEDFLALSLGGRGGT